MPKPIWFRSLYWRIAIGFVAMLATILVLQAALFLWLTGRFADSLSSRTPQQLADQVGRDLSEALTENVVLFLRGRLLAQGTVGEVRKLLSRHPRRLEVRAREPRRLAKALVELDDVTSIRLAPEGGRLTVETSDVERFFGALTSVAARERAGILSLESHDASLEAVFDYLVG